MYLLIRVIFVRLNFFVHIKSLNVIPGKALSITNIDRVRPGGKR